MVSKYWGSTGTTRGSRYCIIQWAVQVADKLAALASSHSVSTPCTNEKACENPLACMLGDCAGAVGNAKVFVLAPLYLHRGQKYVESILWVRVEIMGSIIIRLD